MVANEVINCPVCGTPMNHHADKLIYGSGEEDGTEDRIEACYRCPNCGAGETRTIAMIER